VREQVGFVQQEPLLFPESILENIRYGKAEATFDQDEMEATEEKLRKGQLTLDDFLDQMRQVRKMGPLEGVLGMMPGGKKMLAQAQQQGGAIPGEKDLARMEAIVLSMTSQERRHPEVIKGSRRKRIAAGSGTSIAEVNKLLKGFDQMQSVMKMLGGGKGTKGVRGKARMLKQLRNIDTSQLPL